MQAIYVDHYGDSAQLKFGECKQPVPSAGQVLVRVHAAAVNPRDWLVREGKYAFKFALPKFPIILGSDVSGEVVAIGPGCQQFALGDQVFGMQPLFGGMGGYAEFIAIAETALAPKPASVSHIDAAAVPCAGLTAWQALVTIGQLKPAQLVTVCGASGGVGSYAVQFAKALGARVTAVCGPNNVELMQKLGADAVVNYKAQHYTEVVRNQDLVFDAVGRDHFGRAKRALKPSGRYVSTIPGIGIGWTALRTNTLRAVTFGRARSAHLVLVRPLGTQLTPIAALLASGKVRSVIDSTFPLAQAREAQEKSRTWHACGKIVLTIGDS